VTPPGTETVGVLLALLSCVLSGLGSVTNEIALRRDGHLHSLLLQNALLYSFCALFTGFAMLGRNGGALLSGQASVFQGFDLRVSMLVLVNAITGISLSLVLKFQSSLVKSVAHVCATLLSLLLEAVSSKTWPVPAVWCALVVVATSTLLFTWEGPPRSNMPVQRATLESEKGERV